MPSNTPLELIRQCFRNQQWKFQDVKGDVVLSGWNAPNTKLHLLIQYSDEFKAFRFTVSDWAKIPLDASHLKSALIYLADMNTRVIFGAFAFDKSDGEVSFGYSLPIDDVPPSETIIVNVVRKMLGACNEIFPEFMKIVWSDTSRKPPASSQETTPT